VKISAQPFHWREIHFQGARPTVRRRQTAASAGGSHNANVHEDGRRALLITGLHFLDADKPGTTVGDLTQSSIEVTPAL